MARLLTDYENGFLNGKKYIIHNKDPLNKTKEFHQLLISTGIKSVKLPLQSPDLNPYAERFVKSVKMEKEMKLQQPAQMAKLTWRCAWRGRVEKNAFR